jgi:hypothetical protein
MYGFSMMSLEAEVLIQLVKIKADLLKKQIFSSIAGKI